MVIDGIDEINKQDALLLQKVRRLLKALKKNNVRKQVRVLVPLPQHSLMLCGENNHLKHFDYIEFFQPEISMNKFIRRVFSREFINRATLLKCRQLLDSVLENTNKNLHAFEVDYQNRRTPIQFSSEIQTLSCATIRVPYRIIVQGLGVASWF